MRVRQLRVKQQTRVDVVEDGGDDLEVFRRGMGESAAADVNHEGDDVSEEELRHDGESGRERQASRRERGRE
jgi:hypothetical protein